jgi:hypothetical protein
MVETPARRATSDILTIAGRLSYGSIPAELCRMAALERNARTTDITFGMVPECIDK